MFSEILLVKPKIDDSDARKMEANLSSRFKKISKSFGKGLLDVLKGGGIAAIGISLIDKILNPLKEVQESIDSILKRGDDVATSAKQFDTSAGKLFKTIELAKASGLDESGLFTLMTKFQTSVANAKANPFDQNYSAVKNYVGKADTNDAFIEFIQELKKMTRDQQLLVQQQVFGEKQVGRMSSFLNADFNKLSKDTGLDKVSSSALTASVENANQMNYLKQTLDIQRDTKTFMDRSGIITGKTISELNEISKRDDEKLTKQMSNVDMYVALDQRAKDIQDLLDKGVTLLGKVFIKVEDFTKESIPVVKKIMDMPELRGIFNLYSIGKKPR